MNLSAAAKHGEYPHHLAILEALADGVEPLTGEPLPDESVYHHRKVMAALQAGFAALQKQQTKEAQRSWLNSTEAPMLGSLGRAVNNCSLQSVRKVSVFPTCSNGIRPGWSWSNPMDGGATVFSRSSSHGDIEEDDANRKPQKKLPLPVGIEGGTYLSVSPKKWANIMTTETTIPIATAEAQPPQATTPSHAERKLVSRLGYSIDENAQYASKLKDMSLGYAAASGLSEKEAQERVTALFKEHNGIGIQEYLEQERESRGLINDSPSRGRR